MAEPWEAEPLYSVIATQDSLDPTPTAGGAGKAKLLLGFGRVARWSDWAPTRIQTTELAIFALVFVSRLQDLQESGERKKSRVVVSTVANLR